MTGLCLMLAACARMGNPDGGWYDDTPPSVIHATPAENDTNVTSRKIHIYFDEFIKVDDPLSKVIISPTQKKQPDIRTLGKRLNITLKDSLRENTTYTFDFGDAITDFSEGNPLENYTYSFSTGNHIDSLQVAGYCLDAQNLEPVKGIAVGLYSDFSDTIFMHEPMERVSRTDSRGKFSIKGVAQGNYRVYALQDMDDNMIFSQKSEMVAFRHDTITPSFKPDARQDTVWRDSLHIDKIIRRGYTHFLPDDVTLLCFVKPQTDRHFIKADRSTPEKFTFYFTYGSDSLPTVRGLNFNDSDAFILEASAKKDTLTYWLRDTTLVNQDTLRMELTYLATDTTDMLASQTDTMEILPKTFYEKRMKERAKEVEKWQKEQEKKKKRDLPYDSIMPTPTLRMKISTGGAMDPDERLTIEAPEPLVRCDTSAIHLYVKKDTLWYDMPRQLVQRKLRTYELLADFKPGTEYSLEIDSAAFEGIYGLVSPGIKQGLKVKTENEYATLLVEIANKIDAPVIVQLLDKSDNVQRMAKANASNEAYFEYVKPATYYLRAFVDKNGNGIWDTGEYEQDLQPEPVYYFPEEVECKAKWDVTRQWNLTRLPLYRQKPQAITKQKPDKQKKLRNRNADRAKNLGIPWPPKNMTR